MAATTDTRPGADGGSAPRAKALRAAPQVKTTSSAPQATSPSLLSPEVIYAAHRPVHGTQVYGSPRRYTGTSLEALARASADRMQGAAEVLTARAYKLGCETDIGLVFIAQGLFDEVHLLRTALWAASRQRDEEEREADRRHEARTAARAAKSATPKKAHRS